MGWRILDLRREEVFAAANDHVFEPTYDIDIALGIYRRQVTRVQPALSIDGLDGLLWHMVIASHDQVALAAQLAALPTWHYFTSGRMDKLELGMGQRHPNRGGSALKRIIRQRQCNGRAGFGLPKADRYIRPDALFDLLHQVDGYWSTSATDLRERGEISRREVGML